MKKTKVTEAEAGGEHYFVIEDGDGDRWWFSELVPDSYRLADAPLHEDYEDQILYLPLAVIEALYRLTRPTKTPTKKKGAARGKSK